ncbi:uncharacterized protein LOC136077954 isoform X2 [Hydra vulgaris]
METLNFKKYLDDNRLLSLCSLINTSDAGSVNKSNDNTFYMCEVVSLTQTTHVCNDDGYCVNFDQSIIDSYSNWQCTETYICDGLKVGLLLTDEYSDSNDTDVASAVGYAFILNPITNCIIDCINYSYISIDFIVQDYTPETTAATTTTNFYNDTSQTNASKTTKEMLATTTRARYWLQCFQLNPLSQTWEINDCSTVTSESYVTCYCPGPFPIRVFWINEDVKGNLIPFTVQPCIPITTTVEPSTTTSVLENTTTTLNSTTTLNPSYAVVNCQCSFKKPYNQDDDTSVCDACQNHFNLTNDNFQSCATSNGSTIVNFQLVGAPKYVDNILATVQSLIQNGKLTITINEVRYTASNDSFFFTTTKKPTMATIETTNTGYAARSITTYATGNTTTTTLNPAYVVVKLSFSLAKPYNKSDDTSVCKACQYKLNLTNDKIKSCATSNGSTIVNFELIDVSNGLYNDLASIKSLIQNGNLKIIINGVEYVASNDSFKYSYLNDSKATLPPTLSDDDDNHLTDAEIAITVVCVIVGVLGLIIIGVFFYMNHKKKHNKRPVSPCDSTSPIDPEAKRHKHSLSEKHGQHNPAFEQKHY